MEKTYLLIRTENRRIRSIVAVHESLETASRFGNTYIAEAYAPIKAQETRELAIIEGDLGTALNIHNTRRYRTSLQAVERGDLWTLVH